MLKTIADLKPCKMISADKQLSKINEEIWEFRAVIDDLKAKDKASRFNAGMELVDVITACNTLLQAEFTDEEIHELVYYVNLKNEKREYLR